MPSLFDPIQLGAIHAANRVWMSPLTRGRSTRGHVPTPIMADYYRQRASAGLIITEGTSPSPNGLGYPRIPGLFKEAQVKGWKLVTDAVCGLNEAAAREMTAAFQARGGVLTTVAEIQAAAA